jgi:hypothetical protein
MVTFLDTLIDAVSQDPVAGVLRSIKVLAARIDSSVLAGWADRELSGYSPSDPLPSYRGPFHTEVYVRYQYSSGGLSTLADVMWSLPTDVFDEQIRQTKVIQLYEVKFMQPIVRIEELGSQGGLLIRPWGPDAVNLINTLIGLKTLDISPGYTLAEAENRFDSNLAVKAVNSVRDRVLDLAVGLERVAPTAGERGGPSAVSSAMQAIIMTAVG